ncbi:ribosome recycling factor [Acidaminobacter sp. JC074]|uniref:ribosome recycling factor n=1 Tax=Acidaminobacter sp. JC074 TaxID=2530199 RepID=UPI001F1075D9|nr:ribosome recycling factor [Acidaminobacter sp. JC074]MCH4888755.1 ribosome recycling factor [Acidaminobacter sp. JC074]
MVKTILNELNEKMDKTISVLKDEFMTIRAGKANPSVLNKVSVEYYGADTPLNQMASISAPEPRMIVVQPYDATMITDIEKAIMMADLGMNPSNDGKLIRIAIPMLTEERRKELTKVVKKTGENAKVALRNERRQAMDALKKMHKANELTDDDIRSAEKDVQDAMDKHTKVIDELIAEKEQDIMAV